MAKDVLCESALEERFFSLLDEMEDVLVVQEQPLKVDLPGRDWPYHPDAFVGFTDGRCVVAEIKPDDCMAYFETIFKFNRLAQKCERDGFGIFLGNANTAVQDVFRMKPHEDLRNAVLAQVSRGSMHEGDWEQIGRRLNAPIVGLRAIVLQDRLWFNEDPFEVRLPSADERLELERFTDRLIPPVAPFPDACSDQTRVVPEEDDGEATATG